MRSSQDRQAGNTAAPLARRVPTSGASWSKAVAESVASFFQTVAKSEELLVDALRSRVGSTNVKGLDDKQETRRWQDIQVYLMERRLEQAALTKLLQGGGADATAAYPSDAVAVLVADPFPSHHAQAQRIAELKCSSGQLAAHVRGLYEEVAALRTRLDMAVTAPEQSLQAEGVNVEQRDAGSPPAALQDVVGVEEQRAVEDQRCADLQSLRAELAKAKRKQSELEETVAMLRRTVKAQRKTNDSLVHSLDVNEQHLRECWTRINGLWE